MFNFKKVSNIYTSLFTIDRFLVSFFGTIYPLYALSIGLTNFEMTLLNAVFFHFMIMVLELPTGIIADAFNKKLSVVLGFLIFGIGLIFFFIPNFWFFALGEFLGAVGCSLVSGAFTAWLIEKTGEKESQKVIANSHFYANISGILAGLLAGYLATVIGYANIFLISGIAFIITSLLAFLFMSKDENKKIHQKYGLEKYLEINGQVWHFFQSQKEKMVLSLLASSMFLGYIGLFMFWQPVFTKNGLDLRFVGLVSAIISISMAIGNKIANRFKSNKKALNFGIFLMFFGMLILASLVRFNFYLAIIGFAIFELGYGLYQPKLISFFNEGLPNKIRSSLNSILSLIMKIGSTAGLLLAGFIADIITRENYLILAASWIFLVWLAFSWLFRKIKLDSD